MVAGTGRRSRRQRWADGQNEKRRQAFDEAFAAWQRDDHEAQRMLAAARTFAGLPAQQVMTYLELRRGEVPFCLLPDVALVETAAALALDPPGYTSFSAYPGPPGLPFAGTIVDTGVAVVTDKRIVVVGTHRREWLYTKLIGLTHLPDNRTTLMRVTNRVKLSGLTMSPAAALSFRFNTALAWADFTHDRSGFIGHLERQIADHQSRRPQPPQPAIAEQAPLLARFSPVATVGIAVVVILVLCGIIGLLAPRTGTDPSGVGHSLPPAAAPLQTSQTEAAPTTTSPVRSAPTTTQPAPPQTSSSTTRPHTRAALPPPRRTTPTPAKILSLCGAPKNPYGYNYCGRGARIFDPKLDICSYFDCIPAFWDGVGYMIECDDGMVSMSGGRPGSCSHHGGKNRTVYDG